MIAEADLKEWQKPPIEAMLNIYDFEAVAQRVMEPTAWAYYSSGGDDEITLRENRRAYQRIYFKPRVLVGVANIDLTTTICGSRGGCKSVEEAPKNSAGDWSKVGRAI